MRDILLGYGVRTPMRIIPTGTPSDLLQEGNGMRFRLQHGIPLERPALIHVGRIAFEKNIDFLLYVVQRLKRHYPNILLIFAGEGPAQRYLKELGAQLTLTKNLLFVGYLPRGAALADCYRAGDAFIFASRTETQGLVLLEAMSLGVPVVSTAVMGTRDILQDSRGALVAEETVEDFAGKVHQVLQNRQLGQRLAAEGPVYARQWRPECLAQRLADFYQEIIVQRNGASFSKRMFF
jgi:glycosyltransferase involved in cell wall biosynthesis